MSRCLDSPDHSGRNSPTGWPGPPHQGATPANNNNNKVSSSGMGLKVTSYNLGTTMTCCKSHSSDILWQGAPE